MKLRPRHGIAVALLALAVAGCEQLLTRPILYSTVRVEARSRSGVPLPGIRAELYTGPRTMGYATTDDSGRAVFSRVPPSQYGIYMKLPPEFALLSEFLPVPDGNIIDGIDLEAGVDTTFRFTFARRGTGAIEAEVVDQTDAPIAGITVTAYQPTAIIASGVSDAQGIARIPVPIGQYGAFVIPPDSLGVPGAAGIYLDGFAVDRDTPARPRFVLQRCIGTIRPQVLDQDDQPVPGVPITLYTGSTIRTTQPTDAQGRVSFANTPCGNWGVIAGAISGYTVTFARGQGFQDGLTLTNAATLEPTLRATRQ